MTNSQPEPCPYDQHHSSSPLSTKELNSAELQSNQPYSSECPPKDRKRLVSWGGTEDHWHDKAAFEISCDLSRVASSGAASTRGPSLSRASSRVRDKQNKSQRLLQKSMQLEDSLLHGSTPRLIHVNDPKKTNDKFDFCGNEIRTSKYTLINFLPKNLFIQFHRVAYLYFLAIAALNQLPPLAVFGRTVSLFPLLFVLSVTAVKDGYEDWRRHRSDRNENNREALVLQSGKFQLKRWKNIWVGEVVKILANETMPCDMVLLGTSDPSGIAYIQTMNLDGESNLKTRYARQETTSLVCEGETISGVIRCEQPNRNIYEFMAHMELNGHRFPLSQSNIILRGCQLKNTEWAVGVAVYAGQETKAMLNSTASPSKRSRLETYMNRETLWLSIFLFVMCLAVAIGMGLWLKRHEEQLDTLSYYRRLYFDEGKNHGKQYKYYGIPMESFFSFLSSIIVFQIMIPISLYITMELVRLGQSYFMIGDRHMYDSSSNSRFQCRSLNINEDLGQIRYVFSDKTGTLTENKMEFRRASVWGKSYGRSLSAAGASVNTDIGEEPLTEPSSRRKLRLKSEVPTDVELMAFLHTEVDGEERIAAHEFFLTLAACNTVIPICTNSSSCDVQNNVDDSSVSIEYQGESPDEQALVAAASSYGYTLCEQTSGHIVIDVKGEKLRYILCTAFSTTSALTDWSSMFYSVIYTSVPTVIVGILDKDLSHETLLRYPKLYAAGHRHESYNMKLFWLTMIDTVWQSLVLFFVPVLTYYQNEIDIWSMGSLWTIAIVILVNTHLAMDIQRWAIYTHMAVWGSIIITYVCLVVVDSIPVFPNYGNVIFVFCITIYQLVKSPAYWLLILLIMVMALLPRFILKVTHQIFCPSDIQIAREAEVLRRRASHSKSRPDHNES